MAESLKVMGWLRNRILRRISALHHARQPLRRTLANKTGYAVYLRLGQKPDLEAQRLEVGWLIANLWMIEGRKVRDAIPDPNEAMRESSRYFEAEDRWRHWSQGHMILFPQS